MAMLRRIQQDDGPLKGEVGVPGDKSIAHRSLILQWIPAK